MREQIRKEYKASDWEISAAPPFHAYFNSDLSITFVCHSMPNLYIIGGCNSAGKTTTAFRLLPDTLACMEYVNADAIAAGLSPFNPDGVAIQAGKLMIERINRLAISGVDFAFETTLASKVFEPLVQRCHICRSSIIF